MSWSGVILIIAGALLLANNLGWMQWGWLQQWWPVFLIAIGVWSLLKPDRRARRSSPPPTTAHDADRPA